MKFTYTKQCNAVVKLTYGFLDTNEKKIQDLCTDIRKCIGILEHSLLFIELRVALIY
jgi:hypothetical protein